jgi:hypothetical protein
MSMKFRTVQPVQGGMGKLASLKKVHILRRKGSVIILTRNDNVKGKGTHRGGAIVYSPVPIDTDAEDSKPYSYST